MKLMNIQLAAVGLILALLLAAGPFVSDARAQTTAIDPTAVQLLQRMTDYLGSLKQFSAHTHNNIEDILDSGHRIDFDVSAEVTVSRPNKIRAQRKGELIDQIFYYDGQSLTLFNPLDNVYATLAAPGTFEGLFKFMSTSLGFLLPVSDLVYADAFPLLMQDVTFAATLEKTFINGVQCDHLLFSRPGVDFQVWIADSDKPLPYKYVVTDTASHGHLSIITFMTDWNSAPAAAADSLFIFVPPKDAGQIRFLQF